MLRTHTCGQLRASDVGQTVTLCGWVDKTRDHKGVLFVDLRDRYGKTQVVFDSDAGQENIDIARTLRAEFVVSVAGLVAHRPEGTVNPKLATGEIELHCRKVVVLNQSATPPFQPGSEELPGEEIRLKHRYIDLRRPEMQRILTLRNRIVKGMRDYFDEHGFLDVETPMLGRSTPEGARDYLVPSRIQHGSFYALPQSPQLYKQILMVAGYDRYVQVARCFRDEDLRADRQPEFTQLDMEMSFVDADDVIGMIDGLVEKLARDVLGLDVKLPLPRMTYDEAMERFGHDAPDLRFGMELIDLTDLAKQTEFRVFRGAADSGGRVRGLNAKGAAANYSRKNIDDLTAQVMQNSGAKGLAWFKVEEGRKLASPIAKNFTPELLEKIADRMQAEVGDLLLIVADTMEITCKALYGLRKRFGEELKLYDPRAMHFSWIVEFPMFAYDDEEKRWAAMHHPFTACRPQDIPLLATDPGKCRAQAYDLVINGSEAGGGTIRIHDSQMQQQVFGLLGIDPEMARERFGFLLDALQFGAPPHGGIALGIDRWVMLFAGLINIRDCIAFPKTQKATDLMTEAPGPVERKQLKELGIKLHGAKYLRTMDEYGTVEVDLTPIGGGMQTCESLIIKEDGLGYRYRAALREMSTEQMNKLSHEGGLVWGAQTRGRFDDGRTFTATIASVASYEPLGSGLMEIEGHLSGVSITMPQKENAVAASWEFQLSNVKLHDGDVPTELPPPPNSPPGPRRSFIVDSIEFNAHGRKWRLQDTKHGIWRGVSLVDIDQPIISGLLTTAWMDGDSDAFIKEAVQDIADLLSIALSRSVNWVGFTLRDVTGSPIRSYDRDAWLTAFRKVGFMPLDNCERHLLKVFLELALPVVAADRPWYRKTLEMLIQAQLADALEVRCSILYTLCDRISSYLVESIGNAEIDDQLKQRANTNEFVESLHKVLQALSPQHWTPELTKAVIGEIKRWNSMPSFIAKIQRACDMASIKQPDKSLLRPRNDLLHDGQLDPEDKDAMNHYLELDWVVLALALRLFHYDGMYYHPLFGSKPSILREQLLYETAAPTGGPDARSEPTSG